MIMFKSTLLSIILIVCIIKANAQYVHYDPIPTPPPTETPQIELPQYPVMPPPRYIPLPKSEARVTILSKGLIQSAKINGQDFSQHYINIAAGIAIYIVNNQRTPFMAVVLPGENSNSNGKMLAITNAETPQTSTSFGRTTTFFSWEFVNSGDGSSGTATVTFVKEYRPDGTYFSCHIDANNGKVCDFAGLIGQ